MWYSSIIAHCITCFLLNESKINLCFLWTLADFLKLPRRKKIVRTRAVWLLLSVMEVFCSPFVPNFSPVTEKTQCPGKRFHPCLLCVWGSRSHMSIVCVSTYENMCEYTWVYVWVHKSTCVSRLHADVEDLAFWVALSLFPEWLPFCDANGRTDN